MPLIYPELDLFLGFIEFAGFLLRLDLAHDLLKEFDGFGTASTLVTFDVHLDAAVATDSNIEFTLAHTVTPNAAL
jgi:hypothetical protein